MPLIQSKSKKAMSENIEKEMDAGKPQKQSIAIAYNVQRKNKKKMADGGNVEAESSVEKGMKSIRDAFGPKPQPKPSPKQLAHGGEIHPSDLMSDEERSESIADAIMHKRKMASGGEVVDLEENSEEEGRSPYDEQNAEIADEPIYDDSQISAQPKDSKEMGDSREKSSGEPHSLANSIRRKMRAKRGME